MNDQITSYYINQAGSGITGFSGVRFQRGHGFFGRIFSGSILPILKFLGKSALKTGVNIGQDFIEGKNLKDSAKTRLKSTAFDIAEEAIGKVKKMTQKGTGKRRKKINKKSLKTNRQKRTPSLLQLKALAKGRKALNSLRNGKKKKRKRSKRSKILFE